MEIITKKRRFASYVLLAIFLPMLLLSSVHVHSRHNIDDVSCDDCSHHKCSGHLDNIHYFDYDCVLCQFLSLQMLCVSFCFFLAKRFVHKSYNFFYRCHTCSACCGIPIPRGPPVL